MLPNWPNYYVENSVMPIIHSILMKLMNLKTPAIFGMVVMIVVSAMVGFSLSTMFTPEQKTRTEGLPFIGHVELVAKDPDGNIKAYRQTDNTVLSVGKTCTGNLVFGQNTTARCQGSKFQHIGVGTNTTTPVAGDTDSGIGLVGSRSIDTAVGLDNATGTGSAKSTIDKIFTMNATNTIGMVGLFDLGGTTDAAGHAFAKQALTSTIPVNSGDTLTVKWTISIG